MKKYRIKEDIKKKFDNVFIKEYLESEGTLTHFKFFSAYELEESEERVELFKVDNYVDCSHNYYLSKSVDNNIPFTEQERQDIEKFLNVFGTWDKMYKLVDEWHVYQSSLELHKWMGFSDWLKRRLA